MKPAYLPLLAPLILAAPAAAQALQYTLIILPNPDSTTAALAEASSSAGVSGAAFVGEWSQADGIFEPAIWQGSQATLLPAPPGYGRADAINSAGVAVGFVTPDANGVPAAWANGQIQYLDTMGYPSGQAKAINDENVIVGAVGDTNDTFPALWSDGTATNLGLPPGAVSFAWAIGVNNSGKVLVAASSSAGASWLWSNGSYTPLTSATMSDFAGTAINDEGDVAGSGYDPSSGEGFAALYHAGTASFLPAPPNDQYTFATSINDAGDIVGDGSDGINGSHALLWRDGQVVDLNTLLPADSDWVLSSANSISPDGVITGDAGYDYTAYAYELIPDALQTPEPVALFLLLPLGILMLVRRRARAS